MRGGIKLGKVLGVQVTLDVSWIVIFLLVSWNLTMVFATWHPGWPLLESVILAVFAALMFFASVLAHELAHSLVARSYGIPVSEIRLFLFGGVSSLEQEPPSPAAELTIAIVGPITSIGFGVTMLAFGSLFAPPALSGTFADAVAALGPLPTLLLWLGAINIGVGVFNLVPGFPLDGGRILRAILWSVNHDLRRATLWASTIGQLTGWLFIALGATMFFGVNVPLLGRGFMSGLWLAFIGWFLASAARSSYRAVFLRETLAGVAVHQLMRRIEHTLSPQTTVARGRRPVVHARGRRRLGRHDRAGRAPRARHRRGRAARPSKCVVRNAGQRRDDPGLGGRDGDPERSGRSRGAAPRWATARRAARRARGERSRRRHARPERRRAVARASRRFDAPSRPPHVNVMQKVPALLPVLPTRETVVFPSTISPIVIGQERSLQLVNDALGGDRLIAVCVQRNLETNQAEPDDLYRTGTMAVVHDVTRVSDHTFRIAVQGVERIRTLAYTRTDPYFIAHVEAAPEKLDTGTELEALMRTAADLFVQLVELTTDVSDDVAAVVRKLVDPQLPVLA